ncbi:triacylglycerol lipase [Streptomyces sp. CS113]|uniref:esterase/lipase family protein n=1 Tax=Streptomyces sp. CS113 TaxID=1982761 RepID=UPI00211B01F3|nr:hypothetical protein [Streptomyces sp. CS113]
MNQPWVDSPAYAAPYTEPGLTPAVTHDAVVVVPGIMGSELFDTTLEKVVWGISSTGWLARAWLTPQGLTPLHLRDEELAGEYGRIQARRLLQTPAWSPFLRGIEPYQRLLRTVEARVAHRDAVMAFPYDWRLPVAVSACQLARQAREHLQRWLNHPAHAEARKQAVDERPARLVFIAHSMGGLVTYAALTRGGDTDLTEDTRGVMTLGTPFHGSVVAANILNAIQGGPLPLPHRRLAAAAATMPAVHELLPRFTCLEDGTTARRLTAPDVGDLGGSKDLYATADDFFARLYSTALPVLRPVVGIRQDTVQSMKLRDGLVVASEYCFRADSDGTVKRDNNGAPRRYQSWGDGTVHRESASLDRRTIPVFAQHGALASGRDACRVVSDFLLEDDHLGPEQAADGIGLKTPDYVTPDEIWECTVTGSDDPAEVRCSVSEADGTWTKTLSLDITGDGRMSTSISLPSTGLYRVTAQADYGPTVTQLVLSGPRERSAS